jgi:hypothetical protein
MKNILLILCAFAAAAVMGENILKNGEFNTIRMGHEIYGGGGVGGSKLANVIKPGSENDRCLRIEITAVKTFPDGHSELSSEVTFGKVGNAIGLPAEADTEYEFTFDMLGAHQLSLWVSLDSKPVTKTYFAEKRIRPEPRVVKGDAEKWVTHKCVFKTASDSKFMRVQLLLWGDSKQQKTFPFKAGDVIMIDNVKLVKVTK